MSSPPHLLESDFIRQVNAHRPFSPSGTRNPRSYMDVTSQRKRFERSEYMTYYKNLFTLT